LNQLFASLRQALARNGVTYEKAPLYRDFRAGDVRHSQADIGKAGKLLGYVPEFDITRGVDAAMPWYVDSLRKTNEASPFPE
jgi:UDP-N-acetylglucosamine/UDP-N-acetylgalactosamine 4-epimerase